MKKSLKKTINHLENFVGCEIIRTKPTTNVVDWSYTDFSSLNVSETVFYKVNFTMSTMNNCKFSHCSFIDCDFSCTWY